MKGLSLHSSENSEGLRFDSRGILLDDGMCLVYRCSGICEQKKGLWSASQDRPLQSTGGRDELCRFRYVERQLPRHETSPGMFLFC